MGVRYSKRRRSRRFIVVRRLRWLAPFALVGFSVCLALLRDREAPPMRPFSGNRPGATASTSPFSSTEGTPPPMGRRGKPKRAVYPYSVIPGGVKSVEELKNAIASDSVVSAHYATFDLSRTRILRLDRNRTMHVSYRLGSNVYWTKRELRLAKGETLITDGVHMAREMDTPLKPQDTDVRIVSGAPLDSSLTQMPGPGVPPVEGGPPPPPPHGSGNDPIILGPPAPTGPGSIGAGPWPTPLSPARVVPVPEPSTLLLLLIGLFALMLLRKWGAHRSRQRVG